MWSNTPVSRTWLFSLLCINGNYNVVIRGVRGSVQQIQKEDGSGTSFNVLMQTETGDRWVYVKTSLD